MLRFFKNIWKTCGKICIYLLRIHFKKRSVKDLFDDIYAFFLSDFLYKSICCGYPFESHQQINAVQMGTHYMGCYLKTKEPLDCALIRVCAVIRLNRVLISP